jgi:hypothetical protein
MIVLAICSLLSSLWLFVLALLNTAIAPDKTLRVRNRRMVVEDIADRDKRMRYFWFVLASLSQVTFSVAYLLSV